MLPQDVLSDQSVEAPFIGGRALPVKNEVDYETGGVAIQDPSKGLNYQVWRARILNDKTQIVVDAENVGEAVLVTGFNITEVSLTFDQNMQPVVAYVEDRQAKMLWYDATIPSNVTLNLTGAITPRVSLDDKRDNQSLASDVILAYLRDGSLYQRKQRERYDTERLLAANINKPGLIKIGMNTKLRFQFMFRNPA